MVIALVPPQVVFLATKYNDFNNFTQLSVNGNGKLHYIKRHQFLL